MYLSVVVPVRNEEKNLVELHSRLSKVCKTLNKPYEIIYVENASTDNTYNVLRSLENAKIIVLRWMPYMRKAQSIAMDAGFKEASGKYIVYIDADLQVEPERIPDFIQKLEEGYDVVCGWRVKRKETNSIDILLPLKSVMRWIFTIIRKRLINEGVHDPGSAIKAFTKESLEGIDLYGEMHRFLIAILHWRGFKITEIQVNHFPRKYGKSNYSMWKGLRGFADLLNIFVWRKYADRPLHLFGVSGLVVFGFGSLSLITLLLLRLFKIISLSQSILPIIAILLIITGLQLFLSGLIADNISRISFKQGNDDPYSIKSVENNS